MAHQHVGHLVVFVCGAGHLEPGVFFRMYNRRVFKDSVKDRSQERYYLRFSAALIKPFVFNQFE
jgi:hypothetical protein